MNLLDIIERNHFLKQLYPNGISDLFIGRIDLNCFDRSSIALHLLKKPKLEVKKWGDWNIDYNVVVVDLLMTSIKKININEWQNNQMQISEISIENKNNEVKRLLFKTSSWSAEFEFEFMTYQSASVYLIEI